MSEPNHEPTIDALLALPAVSMRPHQVYQLKESLKLASTAIGEAQLYDEVADLGRTDPYAAHQMLMEQSAQPDFDAAFPKIRLALLLWLVDRQKGLETRDLLGEVMAETMDCSLLDKARIAAWQEEPGRWLPGATKSSTRLLHGRGFGVVRFEGRDCIWGYAAEGRGHGDLCDLNTFMDDFPGFGAIVIGPIAVEKELDLPHDFRFVAIDPGTDSHTGGAA